MNIKKIAILGAGAVGSYIIWGLSDSRDIELGVVAKNERNKRLKSEGITINGVKYKPNVWTPEEAENIDLLIVALKYGNLPDTLDDIEKIVGENTIVMSLMNGVDSEEIIGKRINPNNILHSFIKVASQKKEDGFHFDPETTIGIIFGELQPPYESERIKAINYLFDNTGIHWRVTKFIQEEIWGKFRLNVCNNLPQAILGAGVGCYHDSEHMSFIRKALRREVESIAEAKGIDLSVIDDSSGRGSAVKASARYSTLQDIDAGRHTEIDMFSGTLVRMGRELGIPTPYNEYTYHMIKALEEKNDGMFNYEGDNDKVTWSK